MARAGQAALSVPWLLGSLTSWCCPQLPSLCSNQGFLLGTLHPLSKVLNSFHLSGSSLSASSRLPSWVPPGPSALCFLQTQNSYYQDHSASPFIGHVFTLPYLSLSPFLPTSFLLFFFLK